MHGIRLLVTPTLLVKVGKLTKTQVTTACIDLKTVHVPLALLNLPNIIHYESWQRKIL